MHGPHARTPNQGCNLLERAGGAARVVALAEVLRAPGAGGGAGALPPAWLCEHMLRPLACALDGQDWGTRWLHCSVETGHIGASSL